MSRLLKRLKELVLQQDQFARSVGLLVGSTALGQVLTVLVTPLLTRLYAPADFGVLAVYVSIISILMVVTALRYELSITLPESEETAANLLLLSLVIVLSMSLLLGAGVLLFDEQFVSLIDSPELKPYLWLVPLGLLGAGIYQVFNFWGIRKKAFTRVARTKLNQALITILLQTVLGLLKLGPGGLLFGQTVGYMSGSGTLGVLAWKRDRQAIKKVSVAGLFQAARRYRYFPMFASGSALLNSAALFLPAILLTAFYGSSVAGWFALGLRVSMMPMVLIGRSVADVYTGEAAILVRTDLYALERLFVRTAKQLTLLGALPATVLFLSGPWLFALVFGEEWREAGIYAQLLSVSLLAQFIMSPLSMIFSALERQGLALAWDIGRFLLVVGTLSVAEWAQVEPTAAIGFYSLSMLVAYVVMFVLCKHAVSHKRRSEEKGGDLVYMRGVKGKGGGVG
jgi:O-antigen/teichoic acid export membrane protein